MWCLEIHQICTLMTVITIMHSWFQVSGFRTLKTISPSLFNGDIRKYILSLSFEFTLPPFVFHVVYMTIEELGLMLRFRLHADKRKGVDLLNLNLHNIIPKYPKNLCVYHFQMKIMTYTA